MRAPLLLAALAASCAPLAAQDFPISAATYLGGPQDDAVEAIDIRPDGAIVVGASTATLPAGVPTTVLAGGGDGAVLTLSPDGTAATEAVRIGTAVTDLDVAPSGRAVVAAKGVGPAVLDGTALVWSADLPTVERVAQASDGTVAALTTGKTVVVYDAAGAELGRRSFADSFVEDVAVDAASGHVFVTGYNNKNTGREPIQVAFIRAFPYDLSALAWRNYDWAGSVGRGPQNPNVADSRGYRLAMGADGELYFAGESHGGNTTFFYDPQTVDRRLGVDAYVSYDAYTTGFNTRSNAVTIVGRFDPATGTIDRIQMVLTRLSSGGGNTLRPRGIAADADGRVYVTGQANASIDGRAGGLRVGSQTVAGYQGAETFLLVLARDFGSREAWTVFTAKGSHRSLGTSVAVRGDALALGATAQSATARFVTSAPIQATPGGGDEGYVVVRSAAQSVASKAGPEAAPRLVVTGSPARHAIHVQTAPGAGRLDVVDARGRVVQSVEAALSGDTRLAVGALAPGPYWVRLAAPGGNATATLTVVR